MNLNVQRPPKEIFETPEAEVYGRIEAAKRALGGDLLVLGHHYQRVDVVRFADVKGDSLALAHASAASDARYIVFCGVHFMAETADILAREGQAVILPDIDAGCSMADMAPADQVETAWEELASVVAAEEILPVAYVNSAADIKRFIGARGGSCCTSTNARGVFEWAFKRAEKILFIPDQHLGRNTGFKMGIALEDMVLYDPAVPFGGLSDADIRRARMILWKGNCSVHQRFRPEHVDAARARDPKVKVLVHPECMFEVVQKADFVGSTNFIIKQVEAAPAGTHWVVGTEMNLVHRLQLEHPEQKIESISPDMCLCATMYRTSPQALLFVLERLLAGEVVNRIKVDADTARYARVSIDTMMGIAR
ncbi:MAG: quinolinate synthase NadA [Candidatus Methylomirabilis sp.]|nr:quinolinate synthase NadA [Deltaproteobacteria bacterium]